MMYLRRVRTCGSSAPRSVLKLVITARAWPTSPDCAPDLKAAPVGAIGPRASACSETVTCCIV
eukprot:1591726-Pleurochrysis_carterae.AAC.1